VKSILCVAAFVACLSSMALAADGNTSAGNWPKWRGPSGDCTTHETGLLQQWPEGGPKELWRQPVGLGFSSPVAVDGKVYFFGTIDGKDTLTCIDAESNKVLWARKSPVGWTGGHPGTRATPAIEGDRIYTYGGMGDLLCRNLADGNEIWTLDVPKAAGAKLQMWGVSSNPTIVGDLIYMQTGLPEKDKPAPSIAIAVNKKDGNVVWQSEEKGGASYAACQPIEVGGQRQIVVFAGKNAVGMDPNTGKTLWKQPWETQYDINAISPVYRDGYLFLTSGYGRGCAMFKFDGRKTEEFWAKKEPHDRMVPPLLEANCLYVASEGSMMGLRWPDGNELWPKVDLKLGLGGQYVRAGDKMILLSDTGTLMLVQVTPKECKVVSQFQAFKGQEIWSSPLVYRGRLYAKGVSEMVCYDIKAPK
jgi:outer membrane protein assembly factor BamB